APWRAEDSFLVAYAMWWQLQHNNLDRALIRNAIEMAITAEGSSAPRQALRFLYPRGTSWDAPNSEQPAAATDPLVPPPEVLDLRLHRAPVGVQLFSALPPTMAVPGDPAQSAERGAGSNNWALSGARTRSGAALVANDMHLGLGVPPTWYRAQLIVAGAAAGGGSLRLNGVTLPGMPVLVAGSNGSIAWGFSNSYGDWLDVTRMRCTSDGTLLRPDGARERLTHVVETIRVKGAGAARLEFDSSPVGVRLPQADAPHAGADAPCDVVAWLATVPAATNLHLLKLERASSVDEAMALAPGLGMPHQNAVVGDAAGHIGWTTFGRIPRDKGVPAFLRNTGTLAWRDAASSPRIVDPASGALWSANARAIDGDAEQALGGALADVGAGYDLGARARQIRDDLRQLTRPAGPSDMLAIQTDDRAVFLARWQSHLLALLDEKATRGKFERGEFRRLVAQWNGRASIDSVSYRLVRTFHAQLLERTWTLIMDELGVQEDVPPPQFEGALWQLVTRRPAHLLPVASESWRAFELEALDATLDELATSCRTLAGCTWGARRPVALRHPLSGALPGFLAALIDMPTLQLPGDHDMPRVQAGAFGASERFAVAPGHESEGYFELPGGQSGHPLSPFYRGGFDAWAGGTAQPFLPGPRAHKLVLQPAATAPEASANP
ncbi:MAG TPA: penicillin acylase family protein, partial [Steroidobacteraceae bacterium]